MFAIKWKENYYNTTKTHWGTVEQAQKFQTADKAFSFVLHSCAKQRNEISIIDLDTGNEINAGDVVGAPVTTMTKEEAEKTYADLLAAVEQLGKIAEQIPSLKAYYANIQGEQDRAQEDILHKLEFSSSGNIMFVKLGRMLKECRLKRREAKNRLFYLGNISMAIPGELLKQHMTTLKGLENRKYEPRVLTELFE